MLRSEESRTVSLTGRVKHQENSPKKTFSPGGLGIRDQPWKWFVSSSWDIFCWFNLIFFLRGFPMLNYHLQVLSTLHTFSRNPEIHNMDLVSARESWGPTFWDLLSWNWKVSIWIESDDFQMPCSVPASVNFSFLVKSSTFSGEKSSENSTSCKMIN